MKDLNDILKFMFPDYKLNTFGIDSDWVIVNNDGIQTISQWNRDETQPSPKEIDKTYQEMIETQAKEKEIKDKKNLGIEYTHTDNEVYKVSLTSDDANGITFLKVASDTFGFFATVFYFSNGTKIPLNSEADLLSLSAFIVSERANFLQSKR